MIKTINHRGIITRSGGVYGHVCVCEQEGWGVDYRGHAASVPLWWRPKCWGRSAVHPGSLSTRRLCPSPCLTIIYSAVWDRPEVTTHTSLTQKHWLPASVHPHLTCIDPHHSYTLNTLRSTGLQDRRIKWLSVKCCCWRLTYNRTLP